MLSSHSYYCLTYLCVYLALKVIHAIIRPLGFEQTASFRHLGSSHALRARLLCLPIGNIFDALKAEALLSLFRDRFPLPQKLHAPTDPVASGISCMPNGPL